MWNFIVKALKEALKEKVTEMTKEEVKEWLDKIGVKVEGSDGRSHRQGGGLEGSA